MNYTKRIYNATKWSAITNIFSKITPPITSVVLARLLTPEAFGVVATINMVISFADIFADAGFQKYLVQHEFKDDEALYKSANVAFWSNFSISIVLWVTIFLLRDSISEWMGSKGYGAHLTVAAFSIPLIAFSSIQQAIYKRRFDFKGLFVPKMIRSFVPLIITVPFAFFYRNCWALIIGTLAANFSDALLLTIRSKWKPKLYYKIKEFKEMFSFSCWTLIETIAIWLSGSADIFIIGKILSSYHLGLYKTSLVTVDQITILITTTIVPVLFAALSRLQNDEAAYRNMFYSFQKKCAIILIPLSFGIFVYRDLITDILLGNQWTQATSFVGLLGGVQFLKILISYFSSEVYRSKGEPKVSFFVQIVYVAATSPIVYFASKHGFEVLSKVCVYNCLGFALLHILVLKFRYGFSIISISKNLFSPFIASMIMALVGLVLLQWRNSTIMQFGEIFVCIVVYFVVCIIIPDTKKTLKFFKSFLKKAEIQSND